MLFRNTIPKIHAAAVFVIAVGIIFGFMPIARGQYDCIGQRRLFVSRIQGVVLDPMGKPIPGAVLTLSPTGGKKLETTSDSVGRFRFTSSSGDFEITAKALGFRDAWAPVEVGHDLRTLFRPGTIRMVLGVGMDGPCPPVTSAKREYRESIAEYNNRHQEEAKKNATQK
jgi:hypothetical protein